MNQEKMKHGKEGGREREHLYIDTRYTEQTLESRHSRYPHALKASLMLSDVWPSKHEEEAFKFSG